MEKQFLIFSLFNSVNDHYGRCQSRKSQLVKSQRKKEKDEK